MKRTTLPVRMSFEECAREAQRSQRRLARAAKKRDMLGPWPLTDVPTVNAGGDVTRLVLDWVASCMSPDDDVRGSVRRMRARARELERNNAYATSYLGLLSTNVIGPNGIGQQAQVRNNDGKLNRLINEKIEEGWERWGESVTMDGKLGLIDFSELALKTVARDGETFIRKRFDPDLPFGLALEAIDCDLVDESITRSGGGSEPEVRMGVEVDRFGRPTGYHVAESYTSWGGSRNVEVVPAAEIVHLYRGRRVNQTRGVTWLGPTMIALKQLDGYEEAELVAARAAAAKMGFFQSKSEATAGEYGSQDATEPMSMDAAPGTLEQLPVGWEFKEWSPDHPTTAFPAFVKNVLRKVATGLGVSYNALASDLEGVNYSTMRSGLLIERDTWRRLQRWWIDAFLRPIYREWLNAALLKGDLILDTRDFRKFTAVRWQPRGWAWVDPLKDVNATILAIQHGLGSRTRALGEQGIDLEQTLEELKQEDELAIEMDVSIDGPASPDATTIDSTNDPNANGNGGANGNSNGNGQGREVVLEAARAASRKARRRR